MQRAFVPATAAVGVVLVVVAAFVLGHQLSPSGSSTHARAVTVTVAVDGAGAAPSTAPRH